MGHSRLLFAYFRFCTWVIITHYEDFSGIWTRIIGVECWYADHLTTAAFTTSFINLLLTLKFEIKRLARIPMTEYNFQPFVLTLKQIVNVLSDSHYNQNRYSAITWVQPGAAVTKSLETYPRRLGYTATSLQSNESTKILKKFTTYLSFNFSMARSLGTWWLDYFIHLHFGRCWSPEANL